MNDNDDGKTIDRWRDTPQCPVGFIAKTGDGWGTKGGIYEICCGDSWPSFLMVSGVITEIIRAILDLPKAPKNAEETEIPAAPEEPETIDGHTIQQIWDSAVEWQTYAENRDKRVIELKKNAATWQRKHLLIRVTLFCLLLFACLECLGNFLLADPSTASEWLVKGVPYYLTGLVFGLSLAISKVKLPATEAWTGALFTTSFISLCLFLVQLRGRLGVEKDWGVLTQPENVLGVSFQLLLLPMGASIISLLVFLMFNREKNPRANIQQAPVQAAG